MAVEKSRKFNSIQPLASYKVLSVELLKQLKENQELIIKNANNLCSPELFLLPGYNNIILDILGGLANFPCILNENMFQNAPKFFMPWLI